MEFREMKPDDLARVAELYAEANQFTDVPAILRWTSKNLTLFPELHLVCVSKGTIVGAVSGIFQDGKGEVEDIAVSNSERKKGIGAKLMTKILERYGEKGVSTVRLWVHEKNKNALPFYAKLGFNVLGVRRTRGVNDVPDGEVIYILDKEIN